MIKDFMQLELASCEELLLRELNIKFENIDFGEEKQSLNDYYCIITLDINGMFWDEISFRIREKKGFYCCSSRNDNDIDDIQLYDFIEEDKYLSISMFNLIRKVILQSKYEFGGMIDDKYVIYTFDFKKNQLLCNITDLEYLISVKEKLLKFKGKLMCKR